LENLENRKEKVQKDLNHDLSGNMRRYNVENIYPLLRKGCNVVPILDFGLSENEAV
jgi:hypothetical protein